MSTFSVNFGNFSSLVQPTRPIVSKSTLQPWRLILIFRKSPPKDLLLANNLFMPVPGLVLFGATRNNIIRASINSIAPAGVLQLQVAWVCQSIQDSVYLPLQSRLSSSSSKRWQNRQKGDKFAADAKVQGLRSRAAFKLLEVDPRRFMILDVI